MATTDKRIDQYIKNSASFAQPILLHLRDLIHRSHPDVEETIKWSMPFFVHEGKILCFMASFKQHCSFGFWKSENLHDPDHILQKVGKTAMGSLGKIRSMEDLPSDKVMIDYIKRAGKAVRSE